jgi:two-component system chemotaxis response regulator CheB
MSDKKIFLLPGKLDCAGEETLITTLLGSCVAVALHDPLTKIGGLNHYLLPEVIKGETPSPRYGIIAIPELIEEMEKRGADRFQLQAKIFGGANVLANNSIGESIGKRNIEIAQKMLKEAGIPVIRKDLGGERGRKIVFNTSTFEVLVSYNGDDSKAKKAAG